MEKAKPIGACLPAEDEGAGGEKPGSDPSPTVMALLLSVYINIQ